jgi:Fe-S cluster assembly scaffold protein SufB
MRWSWFRIAAAVIALSGIVAGFIVNIDRASREKQDLELVLANYFSLFTIISSLLSVIALVAAATWAQRHPGTSREPLGIALALAAVAGPVLLLGIVYNLLLRGAPTGIALGDTAGIRLLDSYAVEVLHVALPDDGKAAIELVFVAGADGKNGTSYPRVQVHAGRHSNLCLVERHLSSAKAASVVNAAVDVALVAGAVVEHHRVQNCADTASCFDTLVVHVGENAQYALRSVTLGALAARSTAFIKLAGRGARCEVSAASIANGVQTLDSFVEVDHVAPDTATKETYRGIATERGKLAFNGKMIVRESAHGADSDQSLKTLLTGSGAEASVRPQLEIYTDKVRAAHGATTGKLDEQMLFYLLSRGIEPATARALLQWAFIEAAVSRIAPAALRREVEQLAEAQLLEVSALNLTGSVT